MAEPPYTVLSRREAVQPSLWDRLVDDLPGLVAEIDRRRHVLERRIGAERLARILDGGIRAVETEADLPKDVRSELAWMVRQSEQRALLERRSVVVTADVLREAVRRDVEMLFNTDKLEADYILTDDEAETVSGTREQLADFPQVRSSVLNYGMPIFAGRKGTDFDKEAIALEVATVLEAFEPRLAPGSIRVEVHYDDKAGMRIAIDATLILSPVPERLRLSTIIDLENGQASTLQESV